MRTKPTAKTKEPQEPVEEIVAEPKLDYLIFYYDFSKPTCRAFATLEEALESDRERNGLIFSAKLVKA